METFKIHYLGFGVQELYEGATIIDAIYHLGAKYGAQAYNRGIRTKNIRVYEKKNLILVRPQMTEIYDTILTYKN